MNLLCITLLVYLKYSKPIIASNRGALPEIIIDGENGFLFDFNNFNSSLDSKIKLLLEKMV